MRRLAALICLCLVPAARADDTADIKKVLDEQVVAWNKGELETFMAGYWKSDKLTFFSGNTKTAGWQATLDRYRKRYQAEGKEMGKLGFEEVSVQLLEGDYALVRGRFRLQLAKETQTGIFTLVMRKLPKEGWRIIHDHTSS